ALEADRHLRERHRRHAVHGHLPRQPPALAPLRVFDRDVTDLGADRLEEAGHVVVGVRIRRHIERPGGPEQQPHDAEPFSLDPQRSRHQPEVGAARHDPELVDTQRPAVGERDVGGVAATRAGPRRSARAPSPRTRGWSGPRAGAAPAPARRGPGRQDPGTRWPNREGSAGRARRRRRGARASRVLRAGGAERSTAGPLDSGAMRAYWRITREPRYSLLFALPLLVFYEL